ncbi:MAG: DUF4174 domain-containing protein [Candidatus Puniceispirillales bacterium]|jgi:hypothetical protein|tara:strand:- start:3119 stop:3544 length:426 start_codon:yes stop_codon:yes gene_type:complete
MIRIISAISIIVLLVFFMKNSYAKISLEDELNSFAWEKRILLLIADKKNINLINQVNDFFKNNTCQNNLRNLELYKIIGVEIKNYKLPKMYDSQTGIWLIGYDGEIKLFSKNSSMLKKLYIVIDSMAIRKEEKLNQNYNCK